MTKRAPWETDPQLTRERLQLLAATIRRVRLEAFEKFEPEKGEDAWSFGCNCYRRTCHAFAVLSQKHGWLAVELQGLACRLLIDGVAVRFYCGDPKKPGSKPLARGYLDVARYHARLPFFEDEVQRDLSLDWFWLLAIDRDEDGLAMRVVILQANKRGDVRFDWEIPLDETITVLAPMRATLPAAVALPPPPVGPKVSDVDEGSSSANDGTGH